MLGGWVGPHGGDDRALRAVRAQALIWAIRSQGRPLFDENKKKTISSILSFVSSQSSLAAAANIGSGMSLTIVDRVTGNSARRMDWAVRSQGQPIFAENKKKNNILHPVLCQQSVRPDRRHQCRKHNEPGHCRLRDGRQCSTNGLDGLGRTAVATALGTRQCAAWTWGWLADLRRLAMLGSGRGCEHI